jgi:hypothetical protein
MSKHLMNLTVMVARHYTILSCIAVVYETFLRADRVLRATNSFIDQVS